MTKNNYCHLLIIPKSRDLTFNASELLNFGRMLPAEVCYFKQMVNGVRREGLPYLSFGKVNFIDDLPVEKLKSWVERCLDVAPLHIWQKYQVTLQVCLFNEGENDTGICLSSRVVELLSLIGGEVDIASERVYAGNRMSSAS